MRLVHPQILPFLPSLTSTDSVPSPQSSPSLLIPPLFLPAPHAQPGSSALMHHGTFCSSESQCDQPLRSDRTATSLGNAMNRRSASTGARSGARTQAKGGHKRGGPRRGGREGGFLPLTGTITSTDSEINGLRAEEAPKHFSTTCEIRCVKPCYRYKLSPCSCSTPAMC